jgi:hypothetical protein
VFFVSEAGAAWANELARIAKAPREFNFNTIATVTASTTTGGHGPGECI